MILQATRARLLPGAKVAPRLIHPFVMNMACDTSKAGTDPCRPGVNSNTSQRYLRPSLQELEAIDILMVKRDGRFSGEAFVLLGSASLLEAAQAKHKMYLGSRFVEVFLAKKLVGFRKQDPGGTCFPRLICVCTCQHSTGTAGLWRAQTCLPRACSQQRRTTTALLRPRWAARLRQAQAGDLGMMRGAACPWAATVACPRRWAGTTTWVMATRHP